MRLRDSNWDSTMMDIIQSEEELDELLSQPSQADVEAIKRLNGDLLILGAAGKMGPSLARRARKAMALSGRGHRVIAVARFTRKELSEQLRSFDIETITTDLLEPGAVDELPDVPNVIYMAAKKFGTSGAEHLTWAMNAYLPGLVAERFRDSRIVAFSTGNVYALQNPALGGATELVPPAPEGEYGQSALARERLFEYGSHKWGTRVAILRLNYAIDLRYGVLLDIAQSVYEGRVVDLSMGLVNAIWQGDANSVCLRALEHCQSPPEVLNLSGPETLSVRYLAQEFGRRFGVEPLFQGHEASTALLSNSAKAHQLFGYPSVTVGQMIDWTADWVSAGGVTHGKPTHFQVRDGRF
jgi:nucleoside-diphosphate-sugar epimerase